VRKKKIKKIALFTSSRAELGLVKNLYKELKKNKNLQLYLFVGGSHFLKKYGGSISKIKDENIKINGYFKYANNKDSENGISKMISKSTYLLSNIFEKFNFDATFLFGDRFDIIPIITNSIIYRKIIFHISGGETTLGAIDNLIRNLASTAANYHFTSAEEYSKKLVKLGENKNRIFNVGSLSIDGIKKVKKVSRFEICKKYNLKEELPIIAFTYHPYKEDVRLSIKAKLDKIFSVLNNFKLNIIITAPNIEAGSDFVFKKIKHVCKNKKHWVFKKTIGFENYQKLIMNSDLVFGNSSSGIIEAPYYKIPTINIGKRQEGRLRHKSVIDTDYKNEEITKAIKMGLSKKFKRKIKNMKYKFGKGNANEKISKIIAKIVY
tara:strand:- start:15 stop:1148 length:1134 start_codon:yes stop_codon:yes gene_type:complete